MGAQGRMEMEKVPAAGFPIKATLDQRTATQASLGNLLFPVKVLKSLMDAWKITRDFRPM